MKATSQPPNRIPPGDRPHRPLPLERRPPRPPRAAPQPRRPHRLHPPRRRSHPSLRVVIRSKRDGGWGFRGWLVIGLFLLAFRGAFGADSLGSVLDTAAHATATSRSQQFIIHGKPPPLAHLGRMRLAEDENPKVELQPQALAITAERIERAVLNRLGASPSGVRGRFHLFLIPTNRFGGGPLEIVPRVYRDGWQFHVGIPETVDWRHLVRGLTEVIVLELANREGHETLARTPLWLNEGLSGIIQIQEGRSLLQEPEAGVIRTGRRGDPLWASRSVLNATGPLTFSELSQPLTSQLSDTNQFARFQASAVLFTQQLLLEDGGPARLRQAVLWSPQFLNWELAFLRAFEGRFLSALEVEKWWAVNAASVLSRDPLHRWTREAALTRLRSVSLESTSVQSDTNAPAVRRQMTLGELIGNVEFPAQREFLERKLGQLREIHRQSPDELLTLVEQYYRCLETYLSQRQGAGVDPSGRGAIAVRVQLLVRQTVRRLGELDRRLAALQ